MALALQKASPSAWTEKDYLSQKFGTAIIPNKKNIEIATACTESYSHNSRKPTEVIHTNLEGDLSRRDFTINAMAMNIHPKKFGLFEIIMV